MTDIRIKQLTLENFKCHKHLVLDFNGGNATVYGDNATGKTSIYDALIWLLFGKDSAGNGEKNIEIKPLDTSGEVRDHLAVTAVEAVLQVNGEETTLRRTYQEVWTTKRGSAEATYDGNTSEYYVDGVPLKKYAFSEKVNSLVDEDTFRMLTSVSHFAAGIPWQERRAVLFRVAGVLDDREIMESSDTFAPLLVGMGKLTPNEFKKKLLAEKKKYTGAKTEIPARINECQKTIEDVESIDFADARAQVKVLYGKQESLAAQLLALEHDAATEQKQIEIREAKLELDTLNNENRVYRAKQLTSVVDVSELRRKLAVLDSQMNSKQSLLHITCEKIKVLDSQIENCRRRWTTVNNEQFAVGKLCPTCGQELPKEQLTAAMDAAAAHKRQQLQEIEQTAQAQKDARAQLDERSEEITLEIYRLERDIDDLEHEIESAKAMTPAVEDIEGYAEKAQSIQAKIDSLSGQLLDIRQGAVIVKNELRQAHDEVKAQISALMDIISKESLLAYSRQRVDELRQEAKAAADHLENIERYLFLMEEYSRYKTHFVEDSINGLFRIARFRLFREQANGGVEDRCDVVLDGVPYISVNNGAKINVGIDIINTLSTAYGVRVPLFVDNAESVTKLERSGSQIIRLVVSENDKELRVNYEG